MARLGPVHPAGIHHIGNSTSMPQPPRTSPTMIRSGRRRMVARKNCCISTLGVARNAMEFAALHCSSTVSSMITMRSVGVSSATEASMPFNKVDLPCRLLPSPL
jgi:hypothetical protein